MDLVPMMFRINMTKTTRSSMYTTIFFYKIKSCFWYYPLKSDKSHSCKCTKNIYVQKYIKDIGLWFSTRDSPVPFEEKVGSSN